jgi:hypothetical protein
VRALLKEGVGAVAVAEVVELKRPAGGGVAVGNGVAVEQHLDGTGVARELASVGVRTSGLVGVICA